MQVRRPIMWMVIFFTVGIIVSAFWRFHLPAAAFITGFLFLLSLKLHCRPFAASALVLLAVMLCGYVYAAHYPALETGKDKNLSYCLGKDTYLQGTIDSSVDKKKIFRTQKTSFILSVTHVRTAYGWRKTEGRVLINLFRPDPLAYGDHVILGGKLHYPFEFSKDGTFSYRDYLKRKGINFILSAKKSGYLKVLERTKGNPFYAAIIKLRQELKKILFAHLSPPEAAIMQAMLWGDTTEIPKPIEQLYLRTGTAHILAVSGFNVGIMTAVIFLFLRLFPIGRRWQIVLTIVLLLGYAVLAGARPPVVRATIMAVVFLLSFLFERESDGLNSLFIAAFLILLMNPLNIRDVGFQLSFLSVLFILLFLPVWLKNSPPVNWPVVDQVWGWTSQSIALSVAAWLGVAGLIVYYFHIVTPVTVIANLFIVPLSTAIVVLGVGLVAAGVVWPVLAASFGVCIKFILNLMILGIYLFDQIPYSYFYVKDLSYWYVIGYYGCIALIAAWFYLRRSPR